jgi:hypothetical protein
MYGDCVHEVKPLTDDYRATLTFVIYRERYLEKQLPEDRHLVCTELRADYYPRIEVSEMSYLTGDGNVIALFQPDIYAMNGCSKRLKVCDQNLIPKMLIRFSQLDAVGDII